LKTGAGTNVEEVNSAVIVPFTGTSASFDLEFSLYDLMFQEGLDYK
jgi:hypothetical protein